MASFPPIQSPCPLRFRALPEPGRDYCTFCEKRVHNLDRMSEAERAALFGRGGSICVAYTVQRAALGALAGAGVATALAAAPAHAGAPPEVEEIDVTSPRHVRGLGDFPAVSVGGAIELPLPPIVDLDALARELAGKPAEFIPPPDEPKRRRVRGRS